MRPSLFGLFIVLALGLGGCGSGGTIEPTPTPSASPSPSPTPAPLPPIALRSLTVGTGASAHVYELGFLVSDLTGIDQSVPIEQQSFVPSLSNTLARIDNSSISSSAIGPSSFSYTGFFEQQSAGAIPARLQTLVVRFASTKGFATDQTFTPDNASTQVSLYYQKTVANTESFVGYIGRGGKVRIVGISGGVMTVAVEGVAMEPYLSKITGHFTLTAVLKVPYP